MAFLSHAHTIQEKNVRIYHIFLPSHSAGFILLATVQMNGWLARFQKNMPNDAKSCQMLQIEPSANLDVVNYILGDMSLLDEAIKENARFQSDLAKLMSKLPEGGAGGSVDEVRLEKTTVSAELENERSILKKNQTDYERGRDSHNKLREERNKLKDATIKLQEGVQSLPQLKERQVELNKQIDANAKLNLDEEIERLKNSKKRFKDESTAKSKEIGQEHTTGYKALTIV